MSEFVNANTTLVYRRSLATASPVIASGENRGLAKHLETG